MSRLSKSGETLGIPCLMLFEAQNPAPSGRFAGLVDQWLGPSQVIFDAVIQLIQPLVQQGARRSLDGGEITGRDERREARFLIRGQGDGHGGFVAGPPTIIKANRIDVASALPRRTPAKMISSNLWRNSMRAVVARSGKLACEEVAEPVPGAGQVLVKTLCCGICGSDLHALHHFDRMVDNARRAGGGALTNDYDPKAGMVMGHEFSAEVLDYGPGTPTRLKPGTRVVSMPVLMGSAGMVSVGYSNTWPGGYGERMVLSEAMLLEVPNGLSDRQAAMTEPFAVGAHAVAKAALDEDAAFLVIGCGPVGLAVIASLKARGLGPVTAADYSPARRKMAERMGADIIVDPAVESPHQKWADMGVAATGLEQMMARMAGQVPRRAIIFECVGVPGVLQALIEAAPPGAQIIVAGVCMQADRIEPAMAITKQLDFRFVLGYAPEEFAGTLADIAEGRIDVAPVITSAVGLDGVAGAFAALADPEAQVKIVVEPALG